MGARIRFACGRVDIGEGFRGGVTGFQIRRDGLALQVEA